MIYEKVAGRPHPDLRGGGKRKEDIFKTGQDPRCCLCLLPDNNCLKSVLAKREPSPPLKEENNKKRFRKKMSNKELSKLDAWEQLQVFQKSLSISVAEEDQDQKEPDENKRKFKRQYSVDKPEIKQDEINKKFKSTLDKPVFKKSFLDNPIFKQSSSSDKQVSSTKSTLNTPDSNKSTSDKPILNKSTLNKPILNMSNLDKPVSSKSTLNKPAALSTIMSTLDKPVLRKSTLDKVPKRSTLNPPISNISKRRKSTSAVFNDIPNDYSFKIPPYSDISILPLRDSDYKPKKGVTTTEESSDFSTINRKITQVMIEPISMSSSDVTLSQLIYPDPIDLGIPYPPPPSLYSDDKPRKRRYSKTRRKSSSSRMITEQSSSTELESAV